MRLGEPSTLTIIHGLQLLPSQLADTLLQAAH